MVIQKPYGYIVLENDLVKKFVVYKKLRGRGYARELAKFLPRHCKLFPARLYYGQGLDNTALIKFYSSLGFKMMKDGIMKR